MQLEPVQILYTRKFSGMGDPGYAEENSLMFSGIGVVLSHANLEVTRINL